MLRTTCFATMLSLALAFVVAAADVSGQWQAQIPGRNGTVDTTFTFKTAGEQLTGTMENQWGERPISSGKISGDDLSFTVEIEFNGNRMTFLYKGKLAGSEIKFNRERKGGDLGPANVDFVAKRKS
jgi:hypothetical protein